MKKVLVFMLLVAFAFTFVACGDNNGPSGGNGDSSNVISVLLDSKDTKFYTELIEKFETKYPQYDVQPIWLGGDDLHTNQATKIGNGNAPDVLLGGDMYTELYRRNLLDLGELIERDKAELNLDDIVDGIMDSLVDSQGRTVFLPRTYNCSFLYYNKTLFDAQKAQLLNLNLPYEDGTPEEERHYPNPAWTIEDFFKAGGALTLYEGSTATQWGSETLTMWWGEWLIHVRQSGGDLLDANGNVSFNNQACRNAMQIMRDKSYGNQELGRPKVSYSAGQTDFAGFQGGKVAMVYGGHTANWSRYDAVGVDWGMTVLPTGLATRSGAEFAIEGFGISKTSKNIEGSWQFIKFLASAESDALHASYGGLPIRESTLTTITDAKHKARCELATEAINPNGIYGDYACTLPRFEYFVEIANVVASAEIGLMMANDSSRISIDECCRNIETKGNNLIEINYR